MKKTVQRPICKKKKKKEEEEEEEEGEYDDEETWGHDGHKKEENLL